VTPQITELNINDLTLDGISINSGSKSAPSESTHDYAPLIVNKAGSYSSIEVQNIKLSDTGYPDRSIKAATSLMGHMGGEDAVSISLAFHTNVELGGQTASSIFTHASLLESFTYSDSASSGYYHFKEGENCTYGKEISDSVENFEAQKNYYNEDESAEPVPVKDNGNENFSTGYLPYVCIQYDGNTGGKHHELQVNLRIPLIKAGCGTYDDPYILDSADQLTILARYINNGSAPKDWKLNKVTDPNRYKTALDINHSEYKWTGSNWTPSSGSGASVSDTAMRDYLRSAYYRISRDINIKTYPGLGTADKPFRGVIDGTKSDSSTAVLTIESSTANQTGGGLINVSMGSVVRNLNIEYTGTKTLSAVKADGGDFNQKAVVDGSYFGGIFGYIKGGDNIAENVAVRVKSGDTFTVQSSDNMNQYAGGFAGIIEGGGLILRNSSGSIDPHRDDRLYFDRYIGRVLDGFAVNERSDVISGASSSFTGKNYSIPDITTAGSAGLTASYDDSAKTLTVTISDPQQLIMLNNIVNSGAASGSSALAYTSGTARVRNGSYNDIGNVSDGAHGDFDLSRKDDTATGIGSLPYLISKYASADASAAQKLYSLCKDATGLIVIFNGDIDVSPYGNGYRALGGRYNCSASKPASGAAKLEYNTPLIKMVSGNSHKLTANMAIDENKDDPFAMSAMGGFCNILRHTGVTVEDLTISGSIKAGPDISRREAVDKAGSVQNDYLDNDIEPVKLNRAVVGGFAGRDYANSSSLCKAIYKNVSIAGTANNKTRIDGKSVTGGIIGSSGSKAVPVFSSASYNNSVSEFNNCSYAYAIISGGHLAGGFIGVAARNAAMIADFAITSPTDKNGVSITDTRSDPSKISGTDSLIRSFCNAGSAVGGGGNTSNGTGGLVGLCAVFFEADGILIKNTTVENIHSSSTNSYGRCGGIIGFANRSTGVNIRNSSVINTNIGRDIWTNNAAGIVGTIYGGGSLSLNNVVFDGTDTAKIIGKNAGGVCAYAGKPITVEASVVKNAAISGSSDAGGIASVIASGGSLIVSDSTIENVVFNNGNNIGSVAGDGSAYIVNGSNILLNNLTYFATSGNRGRFVGKGSNVKLTGVCVLQNDTDKIPSKDIGSIAYNDYFTDDKTANYIVYDAYKDTSVVSGAALNGYIRKSLSVITPPQYFYGDTMDPKTVLTAAAYNTLYPNASDDLISANTISSYNEQQAAESRLDAGKDFDLVLIDGNADVLKQYLDAATNGGFSSRVTMNDRVTSGTAHTMKVSIDRYKKDSGSDSFTKADPVEYPATLTYNEQTGEFKTTTQYDNQKDTFTLVTVTMYDYKSEPRIYHIPVFVRRMLQVDCYVTMVSGTVFTDKDMDQYKSHALASKGEDITAYITFRYNSNASDSSDTPEYDWQGYLEAGGDMLGFYKKTLNTGVNDLPAGTKITLIDCQHNDRRYSGTVPDGSGTRLELFGGDGYGANGLKASDGQAFTPASLSELLGITASTDISDGDVRWVRLEDTVDTAEAAYENGATAMAKDSDGSWHYYRLMKQGDTGTFYKLTIPYDSEEQGGKNKVQPEENYFVVINVPESQSHQMTIDKSGMVWGNESTSAPPMELHQLHRYGNTQVDTTKISEITFNYLENYSQELSDIVSESENLKELHTDQQTAEASFDVLDTVTFIKDNYDTGDTLYYMLKAVLKKTEDNVTTTKYFPSEATASIAMYAYYQVGETKHYFMIMGCIGMILLIGVPVFSLIYSICCQL
ncbi:MAG: hypothetical protein PUC98_05885, partial [Clostridiales bacterium]|nr:hypothetical protein [Clostridiales bacterium]